MIQLTKTFNVEKEDTAQALGSGGLDVLATPRVLAWMENVAFEQAEALCSDEESTVGVHVELDHLVATLMNKTVKIQSTLTQQDKRRLTFEIDAFVDNQKIATMSHQRVIINVETFLSKLS